MNVYDVSASFADFPPVFDGPSWVACVNLCLIFTGHGQCLCLHVCAVVLALYERHWVRTFTHRFGFVEEKREKDRGHFSR